MGEGGEIWIAGAFTEYACAVCTCKLEKTAVDRGQTDRISLTYDPDLQFPASYGHDLLMCKRSTVSWFRRWSGNKRMDRQTDEGDCITSHATAVSNQVDNLIQNVLQKLSGRDAVLLGVQRGVEAWWRGGV